MIRRLLRLAYLIAQHPFHLHRWLVQRGLYQGWIKDFAPFWDTIRPPGLPITDYASYTFMEYVATGEFRARFPKGDHFDDPAAQVARLLSYVKRREMHPLRMLKVAWHCRRAQDVIEFGAGAAPYAHFIKTAWPFQQQVVCWDLPGTLLHRYQKTNYLTPHFNGFGSVDAIVCTEVFEHLSNPAEVAWQMMAAAPLVCFDYVDDGSQDREFVLDHFRSAGTLTGPDKRGLYVWRRVTRMNTKPYYADATAYCTFGDEK